MKETEYKMATLQLTEEMVFFFFEHVRLNDR